VPESDVAGYDAAVDDPQTHGQGKTTLTPDGSRLAALSNKSWYSMNFTLLLPCSLPPPEHGNGSTPIDHRLAFDAERIPQHRRIRSSDTAPDHTNWTKQMDRGAIQRWVESVVQPPGKSPLGTLRGQRFERALFLRVRFTLPSWITPITIHTST